VKLGIALKRFCVSLAAIIKDITKKAKGNPMDFSLSDTQSHWLKRVRDFMSEHVRPAVPIYEAQSHEGERFKVLPIIEQLKQKARDQGLWNLFMPPQSGFQPVDDQFHFDFPPEAPKGLSNLDYALLAEEMGRIEWASEVFNCSAPDTGNMEVFLRYGTKAQKDTYLAPLMRGDMRSAFLMTEPDVASSDATNIATSIVRDGDDYVINGRKWWSSGVGDPRCQVAIVMGKTNPDADRHQQQSMIIVPLNTKGVKIERILKVYGYDHAPHGHCEVSLTNVRLSADHIILGEGRGFEIAQGRLGPGRIHHCMRTIGAAEEALEKMIVRLKSRIAFGKPIAAQSVWEERIANARTDIEMTRLLCLKAAHMMDTAGNKLAAREIAMIKLAAPRMALKIIDDAVQAHGGGGVCDDFGLAAAWAGIRTLRLADGPDEVHARSIAQMELKAHK